MTGRLLAASSLQGSPGDLSQDDAGLSALALHQRSQTLPSTSFGRSFGSDDNRGLLFFISAASSASEAPVGGPVGRIAGQREEYLVKALRDYKTGVRAGGAMAAMADVAFPLSEEEIEALAHYLASVDAESFFTRPSRAG
jgi:hypothetical protein